MKYFLVLSNSMVWGLLVFEWVSLVVPMTPPPTKYHFPPCLKGAELSLLVMCLRCPWKWMTVKGDQVFFVIVTFEFQFMHGYKITSSRFWLGRKSEKWSPPFYKYKQHMPLLLTSWLWVGSHENFFLLSLWFIMLCYYYVCHEKC